MIEKIVIDGNDGTGKTTRLVQLKKMFPNIKYEDRGIFSKMTLIDELFNRNKIMSHLVRSSMKASNKIHLHSILYVVHHLKYVRKEY